MALSEAVFVLSACLGLLFGFLSTDHIPFCGHALARKREPALGVRLWEHGLQKNKREC